MPLIPCPVCNVQLPLDAWMAHVGARQALLNLADLHPSSARLLGVTLRYLALHAPPKRALSLDRVAALLRELGDLIRPARVEWKGVVSAAPMDLWIDAMETMLADPGIRRPLSNFNYLRAVVAGLADVADAADERGRHQRWAGSTPVGISAAHQPFPTEPAAPAHNPQAAAEALAKAKSMLKKGAKNP